MCSIAFFSGATRDNAPHLAFVLPHILLMCFSKLSCLSIVTLNSHYIFFKDKYNSGQLIDVLADFVKSTLAMPA